MNILEFLFGFPVDAHSVEKDKCYILVFCGCRWEFVPFSSVVGGVDVRDEGTLIQTAATCINFVGDYVEAEVVGNCVDVTVSQPTCYPAPLSLQVLPATAAFYNGIPVGIPQPVVAITITADQPGTAGNAIVLTANGDTLDNRIANWNAAFPLNQIHLAPGDDGNFIFLEDIQLSGGTNTITLYTNEGTACESGVDMSTFVYVPPTCYTIPVAIEAGEGGDYLILNSGTDCQTSVFLGSLGGAGVSKSNELLINTTDPEVAGKQYQSVDNANTYLESIPATTPRAIGLAGTYAPDIEAIDYGDIFGDGLSNTILGNVSLKTATTVQNNFYDCQIGKLTMKDISSAPVPIVISITRTATYSVDTANMLHASIPTTGTFSLNFTGLGYSTGTPLMPYNVSAADMQIVVRAASSILQNITVTGDYINGYHFSMDGVAVGLGSINIMNNSTNDGGIKVEIKHGTIEQQLITFDAIPTSGQWMLKYEYNSIYYYSSVLAYNANATAIRTAIRAMFTQIAVAEAVNLGHTTLTVTGDYSAGFTIKLIGYPGASASLFEIEYGPVAATYATYSGTLTGTTNAILVTADNIGTVGNVSAYAYHGTETIQDGIDAWNLANPSNTITPTYTLPTDGTQIPNNKTILKLTGGKDVYTYNLMGGGTFAGQIAYLQDVKLLDFAVTGTNSTLTMKGGIIYGGDFSGVKELYIKDVDVIGGTFGKDGNARGGSVNLSGIKIVDGGFTINGATLYGNNKLDKTLTLKGTIGGTIYIGHGATLNTHECVNLHVKNNGGTWNDYSKNIIVSGNPIVGLITPLQLVNGYPQVCYDTIGHHMYRATGLNPGDRILI